MPLCMNGKRPKSRVWIRLARGIPLAGILILSACSSNVPRLTPATSPADTGVTSSTVVSIPPGPDLIISSTLAESPKSAAAKLAKEARVAIERSIHFSDNDATLNEEHLRILRQHAEELKESLKKKSKRRIVLRAYLDPLGSRTYSLSIVQKRLDGAAEVLRKYGVPKSRIRQVILGRRGKTQNCAPPLCRIKGQRIELLFK